MPRNVRNFWISADIDGRSNMLVGGPRNRDGGFDLIVYQRDQGEVTEALEVLGRVIDGRLVLKVRVGGGEYQVVTER